MKMRSWAAVFVGGLVLGTIGLVAAQEEGSGPSANMRGDGGGAAMLVLTPNEELANRLKLDRKTQFPAADVILTEAAKEAQPLGVALVQMRQRMLAAALADPVPAGDMKILTDAYQEASFRVANIESAAFAKILLLLKPNQQGTMPQAFAYLTGLFYPPAPSRRAAGAGGRGGMALTRGELLQTGFKMTGPQNKQAKALLDEALRAAAPARDALVKARAARLAAVQGGKAQTEIEAASREYAAAATTMTELEMRTLGTLLKGLDAEQRANAGGGFYLMRGMFLDAKRWDDIPDGRGY